MLRRHDRGTIFKINCSFMTEHSVSRNKRFPKANMMLGIHWKDLIPGSVTPRLTSFQQQWHCVHLKSVFSSERDYWRQWGESVKICISSVDLSIHHHYHHCRPRCHSFCCKSFLLWSMHLSPKGSSILLISQFSCLDKWFESPIIGRIISLPY